MVVAQLAERSLPTPEVRSSNPVIGKLLYRTFVYCQLNRNDKNKEKVAENGNMKKIISSNELRKVFLQTMRINNECLY